MKRSLSNTKKIILSCCILIALFLSLDLTLGFFEPAPMKKIRTTIRTQHSYYHHGLKPCKTARFEEAGSGKGYPLTTNSLGFRDSSMRQVPLKTQKKRILFIGDSFTEGIFVPYESIFTSQIALKRPDLDILNAGVGSYCPLIYYRKVDYLLDKVNLKFDELFVLIDISDIQDEYILNDLERFKPTLEKSFLNDVLFHTERFFYNHSFIYNVLRQIFITPSEKLKRLGETEMWTLNQPIFDHFNLNMNEESIRKWSGKGMVYAEENMQKLVDLCKKNKIPVTIVVYPWEIQIYVRDMPSQQEIIWQSFAQKNGIGFLDLFPAFINSMPSDKVIKSYFLPGDFHWNESGHAFVAGEVLNYIEKRDKKNLTLQDGGFKK